MKLVMHLLVFFGFLILGFVTHADTNSTAAPATAKRHHLAKAAPSTSVMGTQTAVASGRHLNTSFDFEDQIVQGKYQYPDEAVTTVENEKELRDLLEVRKDFKDRVSLEATRQ